MKKFWHILGMLCLMLALAAGAAAATYEPIEIWLPIQIQVAGHEYEGEKYFIPLTTLFEIELSASADTPKPEGAELSADGKMWSVVKTNWGIENGKEFSQRYRFGPIVFEKTGKYTYTLKQKADSAKAYVEHDTATHTIEIDVKDEEGQLSCSAFYDGEEIKGSEACVIHNKYLAGDLVVSCQAEEASNGVTFPVTVKLPAVGKYMSRFAYAVKHLDGTIDSVTPDTDSVTAQLAHGETLTIMGIPLGVTYQVAGQGTTEYLVSYDITRSGKIANDKETKASVYFNKDAVSVTLESTIFLYGTVYSQNGSHRYDFPGKSTPVTLTLRAKDSDAPLPLGASGVYEKTMSFSPNSAHGMKKGIKGTFKLDSIVFKAEDLGQESERDFVYYIVHGEGNQKTPLAYLNYNIDTNMPNEKQVEVTVTIKRDESGKLMASVQYPDDSYKYMDNDTGVVTEARFADQYLSTSVSIEHENIGGGSRLEDMASISLYLLDEKKQPMKDWSFYTSEKETESGEEEKAAKKPDNEGKLSFKLSDKGSVVVYGIPNGVKYSIEKEDARGYEPEFDIIMVSDESSEQAETEGVINADGEANGRIICKIVDTFHFKQEDYFAIALPTKTTTIMKGALSGTAAEVYVLPEKIEKIEKGAFDDLPNARFIVIPENAKTPDRSLFPADVLLIRPDGTPVE